ncbi:MAG: tetratricopeptide repeat protein [Planctomycetota bacterium]|jgi:serine/threonine protein kinase/Tfp pilus assembly protein PilF|nr:tetratricopeptide repeat protein [Planctomycetota bacterium]
MISDDPHSDQAGEDDPTLQLHGRGESPQLSTHFQENTRSFNDFLNQVWKAHREPSSDSTPRFDGLPIDLDVTQDSFIKYKQVKLIGRGGMGAILSALDPNTNREVVVKTLLLERLQNPRATQRFLLEAQITAQLEHPNIIPVHEVGFSAERGLYFSMHKVRGVTLAQKLREQKNLEGPRTYTALRAIRDFINVCKAIQFAHSQKIVHRDLKPENIMLGAFGEVLVMDWGLAKRLHEPDLNESSHPSLDLPKLDKTSDGSIMGTLRYMSPEQARGDIDQINEKSDVYALGVILYELLTLEKAHVGIDRAQMSHLLLAGAAEPALGREIARNIPRELSAVILKAMALRPADRYDNIAELQKDLEAFLDGRTLQAASYTPLQRLAKWALRYRTACVWIFIAILTTSTLLALREHKLTLEQTRLKQRLAQEREQNIQNATQKANTLTQSIGPIDELIHIPTEVERQQPKHVPIKNRRSKALVSYLQASRLLDQALVIQPEHPEIRSRRLAAGLIIGQLALAGRDYLLARQAFGQLEAYGLSPNEIDDWIQKIEDTENAQFTWRTKQIRGILMDLRAGLSRANRPNDAPRMEELTLLAIKNNDLQTARLVKDDLNSLSRTIRARAAESKATAEKSFREVTLSQSERDRVHFACKVLGSLGSFPTESIPALQTFALSTQDLELIVEAGIALCMTRNPIAYPALFEIRDRVGAESNTWNRISRHIPLIPRPQWAHEPTSAIAYLSRARVRIYRSDLVLALKDFDSAIQLGGDTWNYFTERARCHEKMKNPLKALADYDQAVQLAPKNPSVYHLRGNLLTKVGRAKKALLDFEQALKLNPEHASAFLGRGLAYIHLKDMKRAHQDLTRAIQLDPEPIEAHKYRAHVNESLGRIDEAIEDLDRTIELDPYEVKSHNRRGELYGRIGKYRRARIDFDRAIQLEPNRLEAYLGRGAVFLGLKDYPRAIQDLEFVLQRSPNHQLALRNLSSVYHKSGRYEQAYTVCTQLIERNPKKINFFIDRGNTLVKLKRLPEAINDFTRAIEIDPKCATAYANRGATFVYNQQPQQAIKDFKVYLKLVAGQPRTPQTDQIETFMKQIGD